MREITPGVYRHFKGNRYKVLHIVSHTETGEKMVVYQALYGDFSYYVRPYDMLASEIDREKYPDANQKYRFERMGKMNENTAKALASAALCACVAIATCATGALFCLVALIGLGTIWNS